MIDKRYFDNKSDGHSITEFDKRISGWFLSSIGFPTRLQEKAWDAIGSKENVLIISPTGTGKTLSAVIPPVNDVVTGISSRGSVSILYITPMKALGSDLVKTLDELSIGLGPIEGKKEREWGRGRKRKGSLKDARLHVGIRTGDVSQTERRRLLLDPPDLLITTPENLILMLFSKALDMLLSVRYIILDEVHEMVGTKRGALLSLCLEYLSKRIEQNGSPFPVRIGLSATISPERTAGKYISGLDASGKLRPFTTIKEDSVKDMEISIRTLIKTPLGDDGTIDRIIDDIGSLMGSEKGSIVVFHNTRRMSEKTAYSLRTRGFDSVMPHHGSLGMDIRKSAEEGLKSGELKAIVSSTSLELGLDIGTVNLVCQVSSPKTPSKMLQRFGRSGHSLEGSSKGILYPIDGPDLVESLAVARAAYRKRLERAKVPDAPFDVLAQFIVGMSLDEDGTSSGEIMGLARSSYPFRNLKKEELESIISLLSEKPDGIHLPSQRLWREGKRGRIRPRSNTKQAFFLNCGTIPRETSFSVIDERTKRHLGELSRDFGETLYARDVIMMGSKSLRITGFSGNRVHVREEPEAQPTIPSWSGEVNSRSLDVSKEVLRSLEKGCPRFKEEDPFLRIKVDEDGRSLFNNLVSMIKSQGVDYADNIVSIEEIKAGRSRRLYIFHLPLGRKVTEPIARLTAYGLRKKLGAKIEHTAVDNGFALLSPKQLEEEEFRDALDVNEIERTIVDLVLESGIFRTRFSHCLARSLLVLGRFRGKDTSMIYRRNRVEEYFGRIKDMWYQGKGFGYGKGPLKGLGLIALEGLKEVFTEKIDIETCRSVSSSITTGEVSLVISNRKNEPSVMAKHILGQWNSLVTEGEPKEQKGSGPSDIPVGDVGLGDMGSVKTAPTPRVFLNEEELIDNELIMASVGRRSGKRLRLQTVEEFEKIKVLRTRLLLRSKGPITVFKGLPFAVHPLSIFQRAKDARYRDLRSAVKDGRLAPACLMGIDCVADPSWKIMAVALSPPARSVPIKELLSSMKNSPGTRKDVGSNLDSKGDELTGILYELKRANLLNSYPQETIRLLGAPAGLWTIDPKEASLKNDDKIKSDSIMKTLKELGPMTAAELSHFYNWKPGTYQDMILPLLEEGSISLSLGAPGPMKEAALWTEGGNNLWLSTREWLEKGSDLHSYDDMEDDLLLLPSTDPAVSIVVPDDGWIEKERVRGAHDVKVIILDNGRMEGSIHILETLDSIRIRNIEVEEYGSLDRVPRAVLDLVDAYERMGFRIFIIDKFMGVPAGETVEEVVSPLIGSGFSSSATPTGSILVKGCGITRGLTRDRLLSSMLARQGLIEGHSRQHPMEVLYQLGSINDRWEVLSRIGRFRYQRTKPVDQEYLETLVYRRWDGLKKKVTNGMAEDGSSLQIEQVTGNEYLADMKDLAKKLSLKRGRLDQPGGPWSIQPFFRIYPAPPRSEMRSLSSEAVDVLSRVGEMDSATLDQFINVHGYSSGAEELLDKGYILADAWGSYSAPFNDGRYLQTRRRQRREPHRGLAERCWTVLCCLNLGSFTARDLCHYSPDLLDDSKIKLILGDLAETILDVTLSLDLGFEVVYTLKDMDSPEMTTKRHRNSNGTGNLTIISPKDRMYRVLSDDVRMRRFKGPGFFILDGIRPVAVISMKKLSKPLRNTEFGEQLAGASNLEYWILKRAWLDLRYRRGKLLRDIRRVFFEHGIQLITDDEKAKIESLYRDIEKDEMSGDMP
ncbi:MAG: DEAD/DEAH box helicase [Thermoplasmatota archaeon]